MVRFSVVVALDDGAEVVVDDDFIQLIQLLPVARVEHQHLVMADRRDEGLVAGDGPALQVRHLVHRQLALAAAARSRTGASGSRDGRVGVRTVN